MNIMAEHPRAVRAWHQTGRIFVELAGGRVVSFPVSGNPRLRAGRPEQLNRIEISPYGLHWPELDEDLSTQGILKGRYGQQSGRRAVAGQRLAGQVPVQALVSPAVVRRSERSARPARKRLAGVLAE
jgi:hypothetical protein